MDEYQVISLFRLDSGPDQAALNRSAAIESLQKKVRSMHAQHVLSSLLRAVLFSGLLISGLKLDGPFWGNALSVVAAMMLAYTVLFSIKGHWRVSKFRKARLYWLQDDRAEQDMTPAYLQAEHSAAIRKAG